MVANAVSVAASRTASASAGNACGGVSPKLMPPGIPVALPKTQAASAPIIATAKSPATRATALLIADAVPVSRSATDVITAVDTGPATNRSVILPANGDNTVSMMPSGSMTIATSAGVTPQPAISVIGR